MAEVQLAAETSETNNSLSQAIVVGRGAAVPWVEYEAEAANFQGTLLVADPLRTFSHTNFGTESSGRASVRLDNSGQFVDFTSTNASNSIVVRNSIPDSPPLHQREFLAENHAVVQAQLALWHDR